MKIKWLKSFSFPNLGNLYSERVKASSSFSPFAELAPANEPTIGQISYFTYKD